MAAGQIRRVPVVGAGTMGHQIALECAMHSYDMNLSEIAPHMLEVASDRVKTHTVAPLTEGRLQNLQR
jgi:3-hydroxyacyl-CoA dehydrogenase